MIVLRTLGEVRFEGGPATLAGRRRELKLAAFLARRAPRATLRTELASLLWENRDDARARQSLRQALLELKLVLGDAMRIEGEVLMTDPVLPGTRPASSAPIPKKRKPRDPPRTPGQLVPAHG